MKNTTGRVVVIVLAGGVGTRMNSSIPKQFLELAGKPIIIQTLERFVKSPLVTDIVIVCHRDHITKLAELVKEYNIEKVYTIVEGGKVRQESSYAGVKNCPEGTEIVLIHDAVRPFIDNNLIERVVRAAQEAGASGPVVETGDTIVVHEDGYIKSIPDRNTLGRIQTPQGFQYDVILKAHEDAIAKGVADCTDDCGLVLDMAWKVKVVEGSYSNIKITSKGDLALVGSMYKG